MSSLTMLSTVLSILSLIPCTIAAALPLSMLIPRAGVTGIHSDPTPFLQSQWTNPTDVLSILLIIGGDIIQKAIAQLASPPLTPVAFSFGWVSYSFSALLSAVGDGRLMPSQPDCPSMVINAKSGFSRPNQSWILGRVLRDFEYDSQDVTGGLRISIFRVLNVPPVAHRDWVWWSGLAMLPIQLGISIVPWILFGNWSIFLVTLSGTILALAGGALPQWKKEKWACRKGVDKTVSLTRGNGSQHVMVIQSNKVGFDLEDLAAQRCPRQQHTRVASAILAGLWIVFLITVAALKQDAWYLLAVGFLGMVQNVVAAGAPRDRSAFGIHLELVEVVQKEKVMKTLMAAEERYPGLGASLRPIFFPGELWPEEEKYWKEKKEVMEKLKKEKKAAEQAAKEAAKEAEEEAERLRVEQEKNAGSSVSTVIAKV